MTRKTHVVQLDDKTKNEVECGRYEEWGPPVEYEQKPCTNCVLCQQRARKGDTNGLPSEVEAQTR